MIILSTDSVSKTTVLTACLQLSGSFAGHNAREKQQEQGMAHAHPPPPGVPPAEPLQQPAPPQTPAAATQTPLPSLPLAPWQAVVFILPPDTSGTALTKRRSDEPLGPGGLPQPKTTAWYHRKKAAEEQRLGVKRRQYTRCAVIKCRQCGQPRKDGKHHQLYSNWYCPNTATVSFEDWEAPLKEKYRRIREGKRK